MIHRPHHILIVDDDGPVRCSLRKALAQEDISISEASSGRQALGLLSHTSFALVLTDIRMSPVDGLDLLATVSERWPETVVILLTGYASVQSAVAALRRGAHDYLIKPVSIAEVRTCVRQGLIEHQERSRRHELLGALREGVLELMGEPGPQQAGAPRQTESQCLTSGNLVIAVSKHQVTVAGEQVEVTPTEFRVLLSLARRQGQVVRYGELARQVYGQSSGTEDAKQLLMPHISNVRRKLRSAGDQTGRIENIRGVGYVFSGAEE